MQGHGASFDLWTPLSFAPLAEVPKCPGETYLGQKCLGLFNSVASPFRFELFLIPAMSKLPSLFWSERRPAVQSVRSAPSIDVLFIPEEQHGASGEANVVPPMMSGNGKVNERVASQEVAVADFQPHGLAAVAAERADYCIFSERGGNAQGIPNADSPVKLFIHIHAEARMYRAKRISRPNVPVVRRENQDLACRKMPQGLVDFLYRALQRTSNLRCLRHVPSGCGLRKHIAPHLLCEGFEASGSKGWHKPLPWRETYAAIALDARAKGNP